MVADVEVEAARQGSSAAAVALGQRVTQLTEERDAVKGQLEGFIHKVCY